MLVRKQTNSNRVPVSTVPWQAEPVGTWLIVQSWKWRCMQKQLNDVSSDEFLLNTFLSFINRIFWDCLPEPGLSVQCRYFSMELSLRMAPAWLGYSEDGRWTLSTSSSSKEYSLAVCFSWRFSTGTVEKPTTRGVLWNGQLDFTSAAIIYFKLSCHVQENSPRFWSVDLLATKLQVSTVSVELSCLTFIVIKHAWSCEYA